MVCDMVFLLPIDIEYKVFIRPKFERYINRDILIEITTATTTTIIIYIN